MNHNYWFISANLHVGVAVLVVHPHPLTNFRHTVSNLFSTIVRNGTATNIQQNLKLPCNTSEQVPTTGSGWDINYKTSHKPFIVRSSVTSTGLADPSCPRTATATTTRRRARGKTTATATNMAITGQGPRNKIKSTSMTNPVHCPARRGPTACR